MKLHSIGINYVHKNGVLIDRPEGSGDFLLIIFKTPAYITFAGKRQKVAPDSAVLFSEGTPQLYGNEQELYRNHCLHIDFEPADRILEEAGLETDMVFPIYNIEKIEFVMKEINYEFYSGKEESEITGLLLKLLFYRLGEEYKAYRSGVENGKSIYENDLVTLRSEIYSTPAAPMSVAWMAEKLNISVPHFQRLYKNRFGVSSYDDVVSARISQAKEYLKGTALSVNEVASLCGYSSYEHFIRQFKQKTGCTPSEYRKK